MSVVPNDYRRVLEAQARMRERGLSPEEAEMAAFEENARDLAARGWGLIDGQADGIHGVPPRAGAPRPPLERIKDWSEDASAL